MIRFYGKPSDLREWRNIVAHVVLVECTGIRSTRAPRHTSTHTYYIKRYYVDADLTDDQRRHLMPHWQRDGWDERIAYEEV